MKTIFGLLLLILATFHCQRVSYFEEIKKCRISNGGREYIGNANVTEEGRNCLYWDTKTIKRFNIHEMTGDEIDPTVDKNYCRNPTNFPHGPWCFTDLDMIEWEYCNIPHCVKERNWCKDTSFGTEYMGTMALSKSGKVCKSWVYQKKYPASSFPEKNLVETENFCRNPNNASSGPWCYVDDKLLTPESCNVPMCDKKSSQIEYFGGYDYLKTIPESVQTIYFDDIYHDVKFTLELHSDLWNDSVRQETSLWATTFDPKCQKEFSEFEYCTKSSLIRIKSNISIIYLCKSLSKALLFITPLKRSQYEYTYKVGKKYVIKNTPNREYLEWLEKSDNYLRKGRSIMYRPILSSPRVGHFNLIKGNAFPYGVTSDKRVVLCISEVGKGRIGFAGLHEYLGSFNKMKLADFFGKVFGEFHSKPEELTLNLLEKLNFKRRSNEMLQTPVIWDYQKLRINTKVKLLLALIKYGLRIVITFEPASYLSKEYDFGTTEIYPILKAAGVWPFPDKFRDNINIFNKTETETLPLVHILHYATFDLENLLRLSQSLSYRLLNLPPFVFTENNRNNLLNHNIKKLFSLYLPYVKGIVPCLEKAIERPVDKTLLGVINSILKQPLPLKLIAPGVSFYPGQMYSNTNPFIKVEMRVNLKFNEENYQLGLYANPGDVFSVKIRTLRSPYCHLHINFHSFDIKNREKWYKWPDTKTVLLLNNNTQVKMSSAFGGLLSLSCKLNQDILNIRFTRVIQVPMFDARDKDLSKKWNHLQRLNTPWAVVAGDSVVFIVSSNAVRNLGRVNSVINIFDSMIKEELHLRGNKVSENPRQLISTDIQIKAGYMHAGYPIGTSIYHITNPQDPSSYMFSITDIKQTGSWGILHEIGHNLEHYSFEVAGIGDVMNNIFTLVATESITGHSSWSLTEGWVPYRKIFPTMIAHIFNGTFSNWKTTHFLALSTFLQLRNSFGWEFYSQIFRRYNTIINKTSNFPENISIRTWINESSFIVKMNLVPFYDLWRWPVEEELNRNLSKFPYFMPNDFLTKAVVSQVNKIMKKYGGSNLFKRQPVPIPIIVGSPVNKSSIEGTKVIEKMMILH